MPERFRSALAAAARSFKAACMDDMRALGVHPGQNFLLDELRPGTPLATGELARRMHVEVPTVVRMVQRMEAAGLVVRRPDPADGRRVLLSLTPKGQAVAAAVPGMLDAVAERALRDLSEADRQRIVTLLEQVARNLGF